MSVTERDYAREAPRWHAGDAGHARANYGQYRDAVATAERVAAHGRAGTGRGSSSAGAFRVGSMVGVLALLGALALLVFLAMQVV